MRNLWIAFVVLATLGSVYPFDFSIAELNTATIDQFLQTCCQLPRRGDIVANIVLFAPIGFTGILAYQSERPLLQRIAAVCAVAVMVALGLQLLQILLPSRDGNLQDVVWNSVGTACGAVSAVLVWRISHPGGRKESGHSVVPLTLIGAWLAYRLIPFVPSLDLQSVKDSLKPLIDTELDLIRTLHNVAAWLVVGYLLRFARNDARLDRYLPMLVAGVILLEVLIVDNSIDKSNVLGAVLAVLLWHGVLATVRWQEHAIVGLLLAALVLTGLAPFELRAEPAPLSWLPFRGFLAGSMYVNTQSAAEKVFLYGSLVYLLWRLGAGWVVGTVMGASVVAAIELAQTRFTGHTPEVTDPLLVVLAAISLLALRNREGCAAPSQRRVAPRDGVISDVPKDEKSRWVRRSIDLREYQIEFLAGLAHEMGGSVSMAIRRIVAEFIASLDRDIDSSPWANRQRPENEPSRETGCLWSETVNFPEDDYRFLRRVSTEMGTSTSSLTRQIIAQFIRGLDGDDAENQTGR